MARRGRMRMRRRGRNGGMGGAVLGMVVMLGLLLAFLYFCSVSFSCGRGGHEKFRDDPGRGGIPLSDQEVINIQFASIQRQHQAACKKVWKACNEYSRYIIMRNPRQFPDSTMIQEEHRPTNETLDNIIATMDRELTVLENEAAHWENQAAALGRKLKPCRCPR